MKPISKHMEWADKILNGLHVKDFSPKENIAEIAQHLAAFEAEVTGWKPTETAPKQKRVIVLYQWQQDNGLKRQYWVPATYYDKFALPAHEDALPEDGDWHEPSGTYYAKEGWYLDEDDDGMCMPLWTTPTHYREITLPAQPSETEGE